jgi:hypothetical protein
MKINALVLSALLAVTATASADPWKDESGKWHWRGEYRNDFGGGYPYYYREYMRRHWRAYRFDAMPYDHGFVSPEDHLQGRQSVTSADIVPPNWQLHTARLKLEG